MEKLTVLLPKVASKAACDRVKESLRKLGADPEIIAVADGSSQAVVFSIGPEIDKAACCQIGMSIALAMLKTF
jgi:hypothetical protein